MGTKIIHVEGMHCRSCELLVEKNLTAIPEVTKAKVSARKGTAEIAFDDEPDHRAVLGAIRDAGYRVGQKGAEPWITRNASDYYELVIALGAVFILYVVIDMLGLGGFAFDFGENPALPVVFLVGLAAGVSTCMALVGGLIVGMSARYAELNPAAPFAERLQPSLYFNLGRIVSFAVLGGLIGLVGSALNISSSGIGLVVVAASVVMLWLGFQLTELSPRLSSVAVSLPTSVARMFGLDKERKGYSHAGAFATGVATFFVPCGFTQAMQVYAVSTGSFVEGSLIMTIFALGTTPGLISASALASAVRGPWGKTFFKFVGVVVIAFALFNINNGLTLAGFIDPAAGDRKDGASAVNMENGVQVVRMDQVAYGYEPNSFTVRKGVPVRWIVTSKYPYTCAAYLVMPKFGIARFLDKGENVFEFTPREAGRIPFSCSMGMYGGSFTVVE